MSQPVKLSDGLVLEARIAGAAMQRSIAGQVEFWARIGKSVERLANGSLLATMQHRAAIPLSEIVESVNEPAGKRRLETYLEGRPFPRFVAHAVLADTFVREEANGATTIGRFINGVFEPLSPELEKRT